MVVVLMRAEMTRFFVARDELRDAFEAFMTCRYGWREIDEHFSTGPWLAVVAYQDGKIFAVCLRITAVRNEAVRPERP